MGLVNKLFGGGKNYPELDQSSPEAEKLHAVKGPLEKLTEKVKEPMEVVPAEDSVYVFIGKPPKNFGMAWIENGKVYNFKTLAEEKNVPQNRMLRLVDDLAEAYRRSDSENRYSTTIGSKAVTITPSDQLAGKVRQIIASA